MKYVIENGNFVGTAEWRGPGEVALDMQDDDQRRWFERYFSEEDSFLGGSVAAAELESEQRDASEQAFNRAAAQLAAYAYKVRQGDDRHGYERESR